MISVNFIGCGQLGKVLGKLISHHQAGLIKGIVTRSLTSSQSAVEFIGSGEAFLSLTQLPEADVYFITTPDDLIESTCIRLINEAKIKPYATFIHCSGTLSSNILNSARQAGLTATAIHPMRCFANSENTILNFPGTYCTYEGDEHTNQLAKRLFSDIGAILCPIKVEQKSAYHAAAVFAANYLVSLHYAAVTCYELAGFSEDTATKIVSNLMLDALKTIDKSGHQNALSGPIRRGDVEVIKKHLSTLSKSPLLHAIYTTMGKATLQLTEHPDVIKKSLEDALSKSDETFEKE
ncbi:MAG: DUF2520 domain-containing protein [Legionella longbeachae]|nr:DUF2520 domain-containing protein [Legionella longbeachae]